jgi:hypothetical protein
VTRCPICKSEAAEIDRGLFDGVGFDCRFHGRFRVSGTVLAQGKRRTRRQWEHALMLAKARASDVGELRALARKECIGADHKPAGPPLDQV